MNPYETAALAERILAHVGRGVSAAPLADIREWLDDILGQAANEAVDQGVPFACGGPGCNGCCRGEVPVLDSEWAVLLPLVSDEAWDRVAERVEALTDESRAQLERCPLLDPATGDCTVYAERPLTCRAYHSVEPDRDACWPERSGPRIVRSHPMPSAAAVAVMVDSARSGGNVETLGVRLALELARRGDDR